MTNPAGSDEGLRHDIHGSLRDVQTWVGAVAETLRGLGEEEFEESDAGGNVTARVSGTGPLLRLAITPKAMRDLDHEELGKAVFEAIGNARTAMGERMREALEEVHAQRGGAGTARDPLAPFIDRVLRGE